MLNKLKKNKKGFTLAELLIVVAIIGVLVAISIPIFTNQLEKSRDAVSVSNIRAAYAEASTAYLTGDAGGNVTSVTKATKDAAGTAVVTGVVFKGTQSGWSNLTGELPFEGKDKLTDALGAAAGTHTLTFSFAEADGACTLTKVE